MRTTASLFLIQFGNTDTDFQKAFVGGLVFWLVGSVSWLVGWLVGWLVFGCLFGCLVGFWLVDWFGLVGWFLVV